MSATYLHLQIPVTISDQKLILEKALSTQLVFDVLPTARKESSLKKFFSWSFLLKNFSSRSPYGAALLELYTYSQNIPFHSVKGNTGLQSSLSHSLAIRLWHVQHCHYLVFWHLHFLSIYCPSKELRKEKCAPVFARTWTEVAEQRA